MNQCSVNFSLLLLLTNNTASYLGLLNQNQNSRETMSFNQQSSGQAEAFDRQASKSFIFPRRNASVNSFELSMNSTNILLDTPNKASTPNFEVCKKLQHMKLPLE